MHTKYSSIWGNTICKAKQNSNKSKFKLKLAGVTCGLLLSTSSVYAVPAAQGAGCGFVVGGLAAGFGNFPAPTSGILSANRPISQGSTLYSGVNTGPSKICQYSSLPASIDTTCNIATTEVDGQTNYVALINTSTNSNPDVYCLYSYVTDVTNVTPANRRTGATVVTALAPAPPSPAAVPIFTPLGLLAMMSGLLWFGKRRRKFK